ncbi:MAG: metallophosphoesterase [Acidobacteria bacterium]|nr:MAG: metallophosphoesterase [Acidobacteriota bacterium]RPJ76432.1 MAG: metallophosphoesterase [Acidobacteriota bacterium]
MRRTEVRLAAVADVHCGKSGAGGLQQLFTQAAAAADILLLAGDLTAYGLVDEAQTLAKELTAAAKIPVLAVLGNHEYEAGREEDIQRILTDIGVTVLDGGSCEMFGVGFAGVKGFGGGFDERALEPWGEATMKRFVQDAVQETLKLGSALARLRTPHKVALVHYSPLKATVEGEPLEIYPFLGSSRLAEPIDRYRATAVFHGHAHHGRPEGRTRGDVPVFNVAMTLLQRLYPDQPPFRLFTVPVSEAETREPATPGGRVANQP